MRLLVAILWSLATLLWLPWFAVLVRFLIDLALGVPPAQSAYLNPALIWVWPVRGWTAWGVVSWLPLMGLLAMALAYVGWRFFWWADDWRVTYRTPSVALSTLIPPLALTLLYRDARRRFRERNADLERATVDAIERLEGGELQLMR